MKKAWVPEMQVWGEERDRAISEFSKQVATWGLSMPKVEPLVTQFGLNEFRKTGLIEYWVANEERAGYCGKFLFVFDTQTCPAHHHARKHETFFVVKGKVRMLADGKERVMSEGDTLVMAAGTAHSFTGIGNALLLEVSMPSTLNDNFFKDKRIGKDGVI